MKLRTAFAIDDDLQAFAESFLFARPGFCASGGIARDIGTAQFATVCCEPPFQVEICAVRGGEKIPDHTHPLADTIEVGIAGAVRLAVNGRDPFALVPDDRLAAFTHRRGIRINASDRHGGRVLVGGVVFLSIQRWVGTPQSVITDYVEAA